MEIIPAIDIRDGKCVRLDQGDFARETVFGDDPVALARRWEADGAPRLHVVDLDGARAGRPVMADLIARLIAAVGVPVEVGGGIRDVLTVKHYINSNADRVVLGTAAVKDEATLVHALALFPERIVLGVDARDGIVMTEGWLEASEVTAIDLVQQLSALGVRRVIYTDISHDGMLGGPNFESIAALTARTRSFAAPVAVIAAGGVSSIEHLLRLADLGVEGAIVGKALYTGAIDLREALAALGA
jgi:phosphoribosylformimino-5-aminoimidazole carboxamide ribotide isomerase